MNALQRLARMKLTTDQLDRPEVLQRIFEELSTDPGRVVPPNVRGQLEVFATAVHVLDAASREKNPARNPVGLFQGILTGRVRCTITNEQEERARKTVGELNRAKSAPSDIVTEMVGGLFKQM